MEDVGGFRGLVWPEVQDLVVDGVRVVGDAVRVDAHRGRPTARCPGCGCGCGCEGGKVHDVYTRRLADRPLGGRRVSVLLRVRRFVCDEITCGKRTFVEPVASLTRRHGRSTEAANTLVRAIGVAVGGRAGARFAARPGLGVERDAIIRRVRELPDPPASSVRVPGVDEFAFRKGRTYGTVLVDMETRRPVDLLPDRCADTFAAWLADHPGVEIVCRDRCRLLAEGAARGAPDARHVADGWHLLHSLTLAVERTAHGHRACLRKNPEYTLPERRDDAADAAKATTALIGAASPADPPGNQLLARTRQRHADMHEPRERRYTLSAIARVPGPDRKTVRRFANTDLDELLASARDRRPGELDRFRPYLQHRFRTGATNASALFREIREHGYRGSRVVVTEYVATMRSGTAVREERRAIPTPRRIAAWIMRRPEGLTSGERTQLDRVLTACPDLASAHAPAGDFAAITRERRGKDPTAWMARALADGPKPPQDFAVSLQSDRDAVINGLISQWSSGMVEGQVTRIKFLKRRSYGRASFATARAGPVGVAGHRSWSPVGTHDPRPHTSSDSNSSISDRDGDARTRTRGSPLAGSALCGGITLADTTRPLVPIPA
ncbi:ISL3 family transposase [Embleya sp. NPDC001921]